MKFNALPAVLIAVLLLTACGSSEPEFAAQKQFNPSVNEPMPVIDDKSGIVVEATGTLTGLDPEAPIVAQLRLYRAPNGSGLLRIENLVTPEAMALDIALTRSATPAAPDGLERSARLGALRGSSGNMNVLIAADQLDFAAYQGVALLAYPSGRVLATALLKRE